MVDRKSTLSRMEEDMRLRGFADSTRSNYRRYAEKYLAYAEENGGGLCEETIRIFLGYLLDEWKLTPGTVNMYNASIRFLLEVTLDQAVNHKRVPRLAGKEGPAGDTDERRTAPDFRAYDAATEPRHADDYLRRWSEGVRGV